MSGDSWKLKVLEFAKRKPYTVLIYRYLQFWQKDIQEELGDIELERVEDVLITFAEAILDVYNDLLRIAIFTDQERDFFYI